MIDASTDVVSETKHQEPTTRLADLARLSRRFVRRLRPLDLLIIGVFVAALIGGAMFLLHQTVLNREYVAAKAVTDQVVNSIAAQDTATIRRLGTKQFQSDFDKANLNSQLRQFAAVYKDAKPVVDGRLITNNSKRQYLAITYRYDLLKVPFYVRVDVVKPAGSSQWQVQAIGTGHPSAPDDGSLTQSV